jgi:hypothetical protein
MPRQVGRVWCLALRDTGRFDDRDGYTLVGVINHNTLCGERYYFYSMDICTIVVTLIYTWDLGPVTDSKSVERERNGRWERVSLVRVDDGFLLTPLANSSLKLYMSFGSPKFKPRTSPFRLDWLSWARWEAVFVYILQLTKRTIQAARARGKLRHLLCYHNRNKE